MPTRPSCPRAVRLGLLLAIIISSTAASLLIANPAPAGTTGTLVTFALTDVNTPVAGAKVSAISPSQSESGVTDERGKFTFVALSPDTYAVTVSKPGFRAATQEGVDVFADNTRTVYVFVQREIKTLATVSVSAGSSLVNPGTTVDVYSVNRPLQQTLVGLNGGGDLDSAYSAITAVPGAFVPPGQSGWNQAIFIRGGGYNEIGYELDGIPTNRSFDNLPTGNLSILGQQSLQVYTGGAPADAEAHGLSGYINQVIRTGTYPGFGDLTLGIGSPTFYNKFGLEVGGATPDRRFTYYVGIGGYNQDFRYVDNSNGAAFSQNFGMPFDLANAALGPVASPLNPPGCGLPNGSNFAGCYSNVGYFDALPIGPGGYILGPYVMGGSRNYNINSNVSDRENVGNFHFRIPRGGKTADDDIQVLYDVSQLDTNVYSSYNDWGGSAFWNGYLMTPGLHSGQHPVFVPGFQYTGALLGPIAGTMGGPITGVIPYFFPSAGIYGGGSPIPTNQRDGQSNAQSLIKVQYQHFFTPTSYLRIYGYSSYSNNFINSPNGQSQFYMTNSADREVWTHDHGFAVDYTDELSTHHLLSASASYTVENSVSFDNGQPSTSLPASPWFPAPQTVLAALVSSAAPTNGTCYFQSFPFPGPGLPGPPTPTSCMTITPLPSPFVSGFINQKFTTFAGPFFPAPPGFEWLALESGPTGAYGAVKPIYSSLSIEDQWKPSDRVHVNIGVRYDDYRFDIPSTAGGPARAFWFNAWNNVMCFSPGINGGGPVDETLLGAPPGTPCNTIPTGPGSPINFQPATLTNSTSGGASVDYGEFEPRLGATYTVGLHDVVRASYGVYTQPPQSQFQYSDTLQQNLATYIGAEYFKYGYSTPLHNVRPAVSYNYDASWEHQFNNTDVSLKLTPFYRNTRDQIQQFFLDPISGTEGGVNAGQQTSSGVEFLLTKGDVTKDGLSALLSYTYTHSSVKYGALPNGTTLLTPINNSIQLYNSYTSACATAAPSSNPAAPCGVFGPANASPCFNPATHAPDPTCAAAGTVGNPYFNNPMRSLLDPNASYPTYFVVPSGTQLQSASYGVPDFAVLVLSYKHGPLTVAPMFQYVAGSRYGAPQQQLGIDPATCNGVLATPVIGDTRYPNGGSGNAYDATTCTGTLVIPDQFTGNFDSPGTFTEPSYFAMSAQLSYEMSTHTKLRLTLTNIATSCFGGSKEPWTGVSNTCGYDVVPGHVPPVGNFYNPGDTIQRFVQYPYGNLFSTFPFNGYLNVEFKM